MARHMPVSFRIWRMIPLVGRKRGMKQQVGICIDANVSDREEHGAGGLAMTFDAKQFPARIVLSDNRIELCHPTSAAIGN
jgi:hypothetical protein